MASDGNLKDDVSPPLVIFRRGKSSRKRLRTIPTEEKAGEEGEHGDIGDGSLLAERQCVKRASRQGKNGRSEEAYAGRQVGKIYEASGSAVLNNGTGDQHATAINRVESVDVEEENGLPKAAAADPNRRSYGPQKAPSNIRSSVRFDYQPDICKDYKETGFCGFGDACVFLHDRGDYKSGWQLEREWEEDQKLKREELSARGSGKKSSKGSEQGDRAEEDPKADGNVSSDGLPFACYICRKSFVRPVVTLCEHYFDEKCALDRFATNPTCACCGKDTRGVFNVATKLVAKQKKEGKVNMR